MDDFIMILVHCINTADGNTNSADTITNFVMKHKMKEYNKQYKYNELY